MRSGSLHVEDDNQNETVLMRGAAVDINKTLAIRKSFLAQLKNLHKYAWHPHLCRRPLRVPFGGPLVRCTNANQRRLAQRAANKL